MATTDNILNALTNEMERSLNEQIDILIEKKVEEFRSELIHKKNLAIYGLLNGIEISTHSDFALDSISLQLKIQPKMGRYD